MKYLLYFKPNEKLEETIRNTEHTRISRAGLHTTLCTFRMQPEQEEELIKTLERIRFTPFRTTTEELQEFDKDSLVITLTKTKELLKLHEDILETVRRYAEEEFEKKEKQYYGKRYNPHITIAATSSDFDKKTNRQRLQGHNLNITKYHLARKKEGTWEERHTFTT